MEISKVRIKKDDLSHMTVSIARDDRTGCYMVTEAWTWAPGRKAKPSDWRFLNAKGCYYFCFDRYTPEVLKTLMKKANEELKALYEKGRK